MRTARRPGYLSVPRWVAEEAGHDPAYGPGYVRCARCGTILHNHKLVLNRHDRKHQILTTISGERHD